MSARPFLGQMRHRVTLEAPVDTPDDTGGMTRAFVVAATVYAQVRALQARSRQSGGQAQSLITHHILLRARNGLGADMRISMGPRVFRIVAIEPFDSLSSFVRVSCEELSP